MELNESVEWLTCGTKAVSPVRQARVRVDLVPWTVPLTAGPTGQGDNLNQWKKEKLTVSPGPLVSCCG